MDIQRADCLEAYAGPARFKSPRAHIICTCHHRGRQQERVFQRNTAQVASQSFFISRNRRLTLRLHLIIQTVDQIPDRHFSRPDAAMLARRGAGQAGIFIRQALCRGLLIPEPDTSQQRRRFYFFTGFIARCLGAQHASDHITPVNGRFHLDHSFSLLFKSAYSRTAASVLFRSGTFILSGRALSRVRTFVHQTEHRQIVKLFRFFHEIIHCPADAFQHLCR